jgi:hypothetical protein
VDEQEMSRDLGRMMAHGWQMRPWVVEGLLMSGAASLLAALPAHGKTSLLMDLAASVAKGREFLGRATKEGPVLYLAMEEDPGGFLTRMSQLGMTAEDEGLIGVRFEGFTDPVGRRFLRLGADIERRGWALVVIDTLQSFCELEDANNYTEVYGALRNLADLARLTGTAIIVAHHTNKYGDVMGSTAFRAPVDTVLVEYRTKAGGYFLRTEKQRYGSNLAKHWLVMDPITRHMRAEKATEDKAASANAGTPRQEQDSRQILDGLAAGAKTEQDLLREVGLTMSTGRRRLLVLERAGLVTHERNGRQQNVYRLGRKLAKA